MGEFLLFACWLSSRCSGQSIPSGRRLITTFQGGNNHHFTVKPALAPCFIPLFFPSIRLLYNIQER